MFTYSESSLQSKSQKVFQKPSIVLHFGLDIRYYIIALRFKCLILIFRRLVCRVSVDIKKRDNNLFFGSEKRMYFLSTSLINYVRNVYQQLTINGPQDGDWFFETFGPGNVVHLIDRPYERFSDYEELLCILEQKDPEKYHDIHKGTPFYYLCWTAFDLRNFEKALFYIDAAISEDVRKQPDDWINQPGSAFLTLRDPQIQVAGRTIEKVRQHLEKELNRFNNFSGLPPLDIQAFIDRFVRVLVLEQDVTKRTIVSAFYVFLLEYFDRYLELRIRSFFGGSILPFVSHLFKGGLIFESLLKHLYPEPAQPRRTLADILNSLAFRNDFQGQIPTGSSTLQDIVDGIQGNSIQSAFTATSRLRNTTGHNLVWDDVFNNPDTYQNLFCQEMNAILYLISSKFI